MSWLFGEWDPRGVDLTSILRAAGDPLPGLDAHVEVSDDGQVAVGAFRSPDGSHAALRLGKDLVAADARLDAIDETDTASVEGAAAASGLLEVIRSHGVAGLDRVASDLAIAWWDAVQGQLHLARDATGNRPLYWASSDERIAFGSDPRFLIRSGITSGDIDPEICARFLAGTAFDPERTGLIGIRRVLGGRCVRFRRPDEWTRDRWFRPEDDPVDDRATPEAIEVLRHAIDESVRDRSRNRRIGVFLSGGRDSGAIAMALHAQGATADCFTMTFDPAICPSEDGQARSLAVGAGHRWIGLDQSTRIDDEDLRWLLDRSPLPLGYPFATSVRANHAAIAAAGTETLLQGYGGELFVSSPLATFDLARKWRPRATLRSAKAFARRWVYGYDLQAKAALRASMPRRVVEVRESRRRLPPWALSSIRPTLDRSLLARTAHGYRLRFLLWEGTNPVRENEDAVSIVEGVRNAYPYYDRRVIRAAMRIPAVDLIPDPEPKWPLTDMYLGYWADSRVKASQEPWFRALARRAWSDHSAAFHPRGPLSTTGLVDPEGLAPPFAREWEIASSTLVFIDAVLRHRQQAVKGRPWNFRWRV